MSSYVLSYGGGEISEIIADNDAAAIKAARGRLGGCVVTGDRWTPDGNNDEGEPCRKLAFWSDDELTGAPIAELSTIGQAGSHNATQA